LYLDETYFHLNRQKVILERWFRNHEQWGFLCSQMLMTINLTWCIVEMISRLLKLGYYCWGEGEMWWLWTEKWEVMVLSLSFSLTLSPSLSQTLSLSLSLSGNFSLFLFISFPFSLSSLHLKCEWKSWQILSETIFQ